MTMFWLPGLPLPHSICRRWPLRSGDRRRQGLEGPPGDRPDNAVGREKHAPLELDDAGVGLGSEDAVGGQPRRGVRQLEIELSLKLGDGGTRAPHANSVRHSCSSGPGAADLTRHPLVNRR